MQSPRKTLESVPPPVYFATCLVAGVALGWLHPLSFGLTETVQQVAVALPPFLLGAVTGLWGLRSFRRAATSHRPFTVPNELVTTGPFRFSRNPLYLSQLLILTALSALLDSPWVLAFVPVLALALDRFIIPGEEARLSKAFGERYAAYCARVRRWL